MLGNNTDADADPLTVVLAAGPAHGALILNPDGSFSYTPDADYFGTDSFTYTATDGTLSSDAVTVDITVNAINDAPVSVDDSYATEQDTALTVAAPGVLANDSDVDGDPLAAAVDVSPSHGSLALNADGSFP